MVKNCIKCNCKLISGLNWSLSAAKYYHYICHNCKGLRKKEIRKKNPTKFKCINCEKIYIKKSNAQTWCKDCLDIRKMIYKTNNNIYYLLNKERIKNNSLKYYKQNKKTILKKCKKYQNKNKSHLLKIWKFYRDHNIYMPINLIRGELKE